MAAPIWQTPAGFLGTLTERITISIPVIATGSGITYSIISGSLPTGLYLNTSTGVILGTPVSVAVDSNYSLVIRARNTDGVSDRTFNFTVTGPDEPLWVTPSGALPIGLDGEYYTINREFVDYTLRADTDFLEPGNTLKYYIADNDGQLPPGLKLSQDGRITGYVEDNLTIDVSASINGGYDTDAYDQFPYEHGVIDTSETDPEASYKSYTISFITQQTVARVILAEPHDLSDRNLVVISGIKGIDEINALSPFYVKILSPTSIELYEDFDLTTPIDSRSFNAWEEPNYSLFPPDPTPTLYFGTSVDTRAELIEKIYQFYVTVTDGIASSRQVFTIRVVDPDSLRIDTTYISVDEDIFDTSASYLLAPIWQSKYGNRLPPVSNLGSVRAGKKQVISLYNYDPYPLDGPLFYDWSTVGVNPDIKLYTDGRLNLANLPTKNLQGDNAIYFKNADLIPVKGMRVQFSEHIPNTDSTIYTITGVIKLSETSGILNIDQPLSRQIPDSRIFYAGTANQRPVGINLDSETGTLSGQLSYQPSYSTGYRFTVKIVKVDQATGDVSLVDAVGDSPVRIVRKIYTEEVGNPPEGITGLPSAASYADEPGSNKGDIFLVGRVPEWINPPAPDYIFPLTDGTIYAYVFTGRENPEWAYIGQTVATNQIYLLNVIGEIPSTIQFTSEPNLGTLSPGEISELAVNAINTNTNYSIQFEIVSGQLPPGLTFNLDGTIQGRVTGTGQTYFDFGITTATFVGSIKESVLTVNTVSSGEIVAHQSISAIGLNTATFILSGAGNTWKVSDHTTSTTVVETVEVTTGTFTTTSITTTTINISTTTINATSLSPYAYSNNILSIDGGDTTVDQRWYFTVRASDVYRLSAVEKEFYITVFQDTLTEFTRIYVKPFLPKEKRVSYQDFITDSVIFDPAALYRPADPEFGLQKQIRMILETGIEQVDLNKYADAMQEFFSRKQFYFGDVKSITAKDSAGNEVYEIIYVEIIDDQMIDKTSPAYAVSVQNMQTSLETIDLGSSEFVEVNERLQPRYMTTLQDDTGVAIGFIKAVPICYTIPGGAIKILSRIKNALDLKQFDFKSYHFDTDRIIIETVKDTQETGWLLYPTERR